MPQGLNSVIDLSHHNGTVDFKKIAAAGIIHKATQGTKNVDPMMSFEQINARFERSSVAITLC